MKKTRKLRPRRKSKRSKKEKVIKIIDVNKTNTIKNLHGVETRKIYDTENAQVIHLTLKLGGGS